MKYWDELFLVKSKDWETEFEYRWLVHNSIDAPEYVSLDGVINGVLFGKDFPEAYLPSLREMCKTLQIPVDRISWEDGKPFIQNIFDPKMQ